MRFSKKLFFNIIPIVGLTSCVLLSGCGSKVVSTPVTANSLQNRGIVYFLPKTVMEVKCHFGMYGGSNGTCELRIEPKEPKESQQSQAAQQKQQKEEKPEDGESKEEPPNSGVTITPHTVADENFAFCIDTEKLSSPAVATGGVTEEQVGSLSVNLPDEPTEMAPLTIKLSDQGTIQAVRARFMDRSAAVLSNIRQGAEKLAEGALRLAAMNDSSVAIGEKVADFEIVRQIEPVDGRIHFVNEWVRQEFARIADVNGLRLARIPRIDLELSLPNTPSTKGGIDEFSRKRVNGLVIRHFVGVPVPVIVDYGNGPEKFDEFSIPMTQAGEVAVVSMESAMFATRSHCVEYGEEGALKKYDLRSTSSVQALTQQLKECSETVLKLFQDLIPTVQVNAKTEVVDKEAKAIDAQNKLTESKKKLAEMK